MTDKKSCLNCGLSDLCTRLEYGNYINNRCPVWQRNKTVSGKVDDLCVWKYDTDGCWISDCGAYFEFTTGTPTKNEFIFCHKCGKKIKEICHEQGEE